MHGSVPGSIKFNQNDALPCPQHQLTVTIRYVDGRANDGCENVVRGVRRVMWMAIGKLRQYMAQGIQKIEVGAWIQVGGGEGAGSMSDKNITDAVIGAHVSQL